AKPDSIRGCDRRLPRGPRRDGRHTAEATRRDRGRTFDAGEGDPAKWLGRHPAPFLGPKARRSAGAMRRTARGPTSRWPSRGAVYYMFAVSPDRLKALLERVARGETSVDGALASLRELPYRDIGVATVDHHRALRQGTPEVIYGESKSAEQIVQIADELVAAGHRVLATRVSEDK